MADYFANWWDSPGPPKYPTNPLPPGYETGRSQSQQKTRPATPPAVTPAPTPTPSVPSAPTAVGFAGLPNQYVNGMTGFLGDPGAYYANYGGEKQAQQDYYNLQNIWLNRTGVPLTPDVWGRVWHTLNQYRNPSVLRGEQRAFTMGDAINYLNRMLARAPEQPMVSYLQTGEI